MKEEKENKSTITFGEIIKIMQDASDRENEKRGFPKKKIWQSKWKKMNMGETAERIRIKQFMNATIAERLVKKLEVILQISRRLS